MKWLHLNILVEKLSLPRNGRDGFHAIPDIQEPVWDAVERVPPSAFLGADAAAGGGSDSPDVGSLGSGKEGCTGG